MARTTPLTVDQRNALVALAYALLPNMDNIIIAGGFAADWTQAHDVDLFVIGDANLRVAEEVLTEQDVKFRPLFETNLAYEGANGMERTVVVVDTPLLPIQIIGAKEVTVETLLDTFDISTHRWAWSRRGIRFSGPKATETYETGRVLAPQKSTDKRVEKLKARYDIDILPFESPAKAGKKGKVA